MSNLLGEIESMGIDPTWIGVHGMAVTGGLVCGSAVAGNFETKTSVQSQIGSGEAQPLSTTRRHHKLIY
eukprot:CAMPEP_0174299030 /NCGR_PEP_ID=MMETSP0809-20121228/55558_1 /TAXON_ID=73025 ORGANISM="Eutreptiella gymnastica-like, Strain CCMP1594" /NCGR_SAMPLE_ID=MMETSP0809 /ASSEMBLY_ACC=CAM_ASM_000658 /LENGTH=68 /DNA_ID=CAMNT_0015403929 /DNA_START=1573 /DNA_END=1779 /DNA_ORIENTATION=-